MRKNHAARPIRAIPAKLPMVAPAMVPALVVEESPESGVEDGVEGVAVPVGRFGGGLSGS